MSSPLIEAGTLSERRTVEVQANGLVCETRILYAVQSNLIYNSHIEPQDIGDGGGMEETWGFSNSAQLISGSTTSAGITQPTPFTLLLLYSLRYTWSGCSLFQVKMGRERTGLG